MARWFTPARTPGNVASVLSGAYTTGQTFLKGALLVLSSGSLVECSATPTAAHGIALEPVASKPGWNAANSPTVITGRVQEVSYGVADRITVWSCRGVNGATDPVTPAITHIGVKYGAVKDANGIWALNIADTTNLIFQVEDIDITNKIFFVKFLEAALTQSP